MTGFAAWSPAQLAHSLGYRINLVGDPSGSAAYLIGHRKPFSHGHMWAVLSRLARIRGVDPTELPIETPHALRNGKEQ